ncbi:MAG: hypothetical protein WD991_02135 [Candidatus Paceibacterota bacterium]
MDKKFIGFCQRVSIPFARTALFVIFFWFGLLKVWGLSPAGEMVENLFMQTIPFMSFDIFLVLFGLFEALIGILFLIKGQERLVIVLLFLHMVTTFMPLFLLTGETWSGFLVPTMEGQYIIKNLLVIAAALGIAAQLHPVRTLREMI